MYVLPEMTDYFHLDCLSNCVAISQPCQRKKTAPVSPHRGPYIKYTPCIAACSMTKVRIYTR